MEPSYAAYLKLVSIAAADGEITPPEHELLAHYRRALGVSGETAAELPSDEQLADAMARLRQAPRSERSSSFEERGGPTAADT